MNEQEIQSTKDALMMFAYGENLPDEQELRKAIEIAISLCDDKLHQMDLCAD